MVTARSVDDLLALVPHMLGFHPSESLIIMLAQQGRVVLTARMDLAEARSPGAVRALLARMRVRFPESQAWYAAYGADADAAWRVLRHCAREVPRSLGGVYVDGRSWWRSPKGPPNEYPPRSAAARVMAETRGKVVRPSRGDLAATVAGPSPAEVATAELAIAREKTRLGRVPREEWPGLMRRALASGDASPPVARLALWAQDQSARDAALLALTRTRAARHLELWRQVVCRTPPRLAAHPLGLAGMAAWLAGDGALQTVCLDRAEALDPALPLVAVLSHINATVLPPTVWPELRRELAARLRPSPPGEPTKLSRPHRSPDNSRSADPARSSKPGPASEAIRPPLELRNAS